jgi:hypothetical protein
MTVPLIMAASVVGDLRGGTLTFGLTKCWPRGDRLLLVKAQAFVMDAPRSRGLSWPATVGWICAAVFAASLWNGSSSGPLFWAGWVYVLVRWVTRRIDDRVQ